MGEATIGPLLVLFVVLAIVVAFAFQGLLVLFGCKLVGIRRVGYGNAVGIAVQAGIVNIVASVLLIIPILGFLLQMVITLIVPTLLINGKYRVGFERAFWAAFAYISITVLLQLVGLYIQMRAMPAI